MSEVEGTVQGHRDGHGFVVRDDASPTSTCRSRRCARAASRPRRRVASSLRPQGPPEGRVLEILERRKAPIIGRLLHESGIWLVAPEDKRYGQDIMSRRTRSRTRRGQVVAIELTEPPSLYSQPVGASPKCSARSTTRHGDRDRGAQVRGAAPLLARDAGAGRALPDKIRPSTASTAST
jgi:ribonuclease R